MKKPAEVVSELMDGGDPSGLTEISSGDDGTRETWRRYHAIGYLMRNEPAVVLPGERFARGVAACIETEPAYSVAAKDARMDRARSRTITGFALAASVAAIAVLAFHFGNLAPLPGAGQVAEVASPPVRTMAVEATRWTTGQPELEGALNAFLVDHGEFSGASGLNGVMSYAKFVSYDSYTAAAQ